MKSPKEKGKEQAGLPYRLATTFHSLGQPNFRLYFFGQLVSLSGTWMQGLALSWLVYRLTNSPLALGVVESCTFLPVLCLGLAGGWLADRFDRRKIMIATQAIMMAQASTLSWLTFTGQIHLWHIAALALVAGLVNAVEMPARQAFLAQLVERKHLVNAISLNSSVFNASRIIGPGLAALLIAHSGEAFCFALNAVSFSGTLIAFILIRPHKRSKVEPNARSSVADGIKFALSTPEIRAVLRQCVVLSLFGVQFSVLLPVMARDVLHLDVHGFGALRVFAGIGSLCGALSLASQGSQHALMRTIGFASIGFPLSLCAFSISREFSLSLFITFLLGLTLTLQLSGGHSLIQLKVPDNMRGRIMSVWTTTLMGMNPAGSLLGGWAATVAGAPSVLFCCSLVILTASARLKSWRRCLPESSSGREMSDIA